MIHEYGYPFELVGCQNERWSMKPKTGSTGRRDLRRRRMPSSASAAVRRGVGASSDACRVNACIPKQMSPTLITMVIAASAMLFPDPVISVATAPFATHPEVDRAASSLWDLISEDPNYSKLTACLKVADPSIAAALAGSGEDPLTLFAPKDSAFDQHDWENSSSPDGISEILASGTIFDSRCKDEASASFLMGYHVSTTTSPTPYIGEKFETLLGDESVAHFYGISKTADVPSSYYPIRFVNNANVTASPTVVQGDGGKSYLYQVNRVLRPPNGTIWETLSADSSFSLLTAALNGTKLAQNLDTFDGSNAYTLFAPDDDAVRASGGLPSDAEELEVLLSFHTLANGEYPQSINGAHFSQQLFKVEPSEGTLGRDYYREFYADEFIDGEVASYAGPLLNITRPSLAAERRVHGDVTLQSGSLLELERRVGFGLGEKQEELGPSARVLSAGSVGDGESELLVEGVPVSEADITASNGVIHRLSAAVMDPPPTVAGVLLAPPYPLSVAGGVEDGGFHALGELIHLAWPLVNETLTEAGPLTFLAPTDAAFDLAINTGKLPPRPWNSSSSSSTSSTSSSSASLSPEQAARIVLSHALLTPDGPLLFNPTGINPFASNFADRTRFSTAVDVSGNATAADGRAMNLQGATVDVGVKISELNTSSTTTAASKVVDMEFYVDNARVFQCVDGSGVGHDCGKKSHPSNTYALNGAHLCAVHAVDRVMFPADPDMDLTQLIESMEFLSSFAELLKREGLTPDAPERAAWDIPDRSGIDGVDKPRVLLPSGGEGGTFTVFAPTNEALARLEDQQPWLFEGKPEGSKDMRFGVGDAGTGSRDHDKERHPLRELLGYHIAPGAGEFSRYFNSSSRRVATLGIKGTAPISATFEGAHGNTSGVLHVNLQKSTVLRDVSASNGVLHVLDFSEDYGGASGEGAGVVVPDVLELTYAYGFHTMYESIVSADPDVTSGGDRHNTSDGPRVDEEASGGQPGGGSSVGGVSVAQALRGEAPHTLLAVRYSQAENAFLDVASSTGSWRLNGDGVSEGTLRYQTLIGDQTLEFDGCPSIKCQTMLRQDAYAFNNSETGGNPFVSSDGARSSVYVDQAQVLSLAGGMLAVNGRIHEISEPLNPPVASIFTLLSSHRSLQPWANWVQLTGLAEILADPTAGPFTVFAPMDTALTAIPDRTVMEADKDSLRELVSFHIVLGTLSSARTAIEDCSEGSHCGEDSSGIAGSSLDSSRGSGVLGQWGGDSGGDGSTRRVADSWRADGGSSTSSRGSLRHKISAVVEGTSSVSSPSEDYSVDLKGNLNSCVSVRGRLFTPSLANSTEMERSTLTGPRFCSGPLLETDITYNDHRRSSPVISVQIGAFGASPGTDDSAVCSVGSSPQVGGGNADYYCALSESIPEFRVFLGPEQRAYVTGDEELLFLGAFASEVVLPNLSAVNGVVHGISGVMTYPGYKRPVQVDSWIEGS